MTTFCVLVYRKRQEFQQDQAFSEWWSGIRFGNAAIPSDHDRAAAVQIGEHESSARRMFEATERRSLQYMVSSGELLAAQKAEGI